MSQRRDTRRMVFDVDRELALSFEELAQKLSKYKITLLQEALELLIARHKEE